MLKYCKDYFFVKNVSMEWCIQFSKKEDMFYVNHDNVLRIISTDFSTGIWHNRYFVNKSRLLKKKKECGWLDFIKYIHPPYANLPAWAFIPINKMHNLYFWILREKWYQLKIKNSL